MMIIVNNVDNTSIVGSLSGTPFKVSYSKEKFETMKSLEKKANVVTTIGALKEVLEEFRPFTRESYKELVEKACPYIVANPTRNQFFLSYNKVISSKPMPNAFAERLITSAEKGIDVTPLVKCWVLFLRNPNFSDEKAQRFSEYIMAPYTDPLVVDRLVKEEGFSYKTAEKQATTFQVAITEEGLINGYKVSRELTHKWALNENGDRIQVPRYGKTIDPDTGLVLELMPDHIEDRIFEPYCMGTSGDEFYCGSKKAHIIKVGERHFLESWDQVNCNDNQSGVKGLHIGGLSYIRPFQQGTDAVTHNIFVNPMHIGAIVGLGAGYDGAMRVKEYFVHSSFSGVNKAIYRSSSYAKTGDLEYRAYLEEVTTKTALKAAELEQFQKELAALI